MNCIVRAIAADCVHSNCMKISENKVVERVVRRLYQ